MLSPLFLLLCGSTCLAASQAPLQHGNRWACRPDVPPVWDVDYGLDLNFMILTSWYPPNRTAVNDLDHILNGTGVFGFQFHSPRSHSRSDGEGEMEDEYEYGGYNWCDMPRVRRQEYVPAPQGFKLEYVEVIHRHHKRTPYAANTFPREDDTWSCNDESLYYYGVPAADEEAAAIHWQVYTSPANPMTPWGFRGTCQFPQITAGGLLDSRQHGRDLFGVYHDLLGFLPDELDTTKMEFRVTNNQITSQVASQVILGMYPATSRRSTRVLVQPRSIDSLEPRYPCPRADALYEAFGVGSKNNSAWTRHLTAHQTVELFSRLDAVSGISRSNDDDDWHTWFDHYFDNLSARTCHGKPLPCNVENNSVCVTPADADAVFRRGEYEYSYIYRDSYNLFAASVASYGVWLAELASNLRRVVNTPVNSQSKVIYRHNVAHDGSLARLLSVLQVDVMVWPGMGAEVVFELFSQLQPDRKEWYLRVLWSGRVLRTSRPYFKVMDMVRLDKFLRYIDGLVGVDAKKVPQLCGLE